ncbi:glycosyltransferase [Paenibacillus sp. FJAT-26967]|uniref:MGDG synthase family glycosyltransferase n=1 Tax=Paenibacillus sp. FJAT-26967 TaxID=1729690 RepID=UPI0008382FC8|nr:glycosyltransferase [Paenibacillus sp. FJAT-26967]
MSSDAKILILYASYGDGHLQVSRALQQAFRIQGVRSVEIVDLFSHAHPLFSYLTRQLYLKSSSLGLYGLSYYLTQDMRPDTLLAKWLHSIGERRLKQLIRERCPDAIVNTFPLQGSTRLEPKTERDKEPEKQTAPKAGILADIHVPTFSVVTDYDLHGRWLHPGVHRYFVPAEEFRTLMIAKGIVPDRINVSGIPVRASFYHKRGDGSVLPGGNGKAGEPMILLLAGAYGVLQGLRRLCTRLTDSYPNVCISVVCGRNERLKREFKRCFDGQDRVRIYGFVDHIHELMAASSCLITKAGGVTLSEALAIGVPVVIYRPHLGQEKENAAFFVKKAAALSASRPDELIRQVGRILRTEWPPSCTEHTRQSLLKKDAGETIAAHILEEIGCRSKPAEEGAR